MGKLAKTMYSCRYWDNGERAYYVEVSECEMYKNEANNDKNGMCIFASN